MSKIQAVILAGGQGSRLRPYTTVLPKPLMPVAGMPIMEIIIRQLRHYGFRDIAVSTGHLAGLIEAYFGDGKRFGSRIRYFCEDRPLGTAGALKMVTTLADDFLVINGDILTDLDFGKMRLWHLHKKGIATIGCTERTVKTDFGVVEADNQDRLEAYREKPESRSLVSIGINMLNKKSIDYIRKKENLGMPDLFLRMKADGQKVFCFPTQGLWLDLGRFEDLEKAQEAFENNKKRILKG